MRVGDDRHPEKEVCASLAADHQASSANRGPCSYQVIPVATGRNVENEKVDADQKALAELPPRCMPRCVSTPSQMIEIQFYALCQIIMEKTNDTLLTI